MIDELRMMIGNEGWVDLAKYVMPFVLLVYYILVYYFLLHGTTHYTTLTRTV